MAKKKKIVEVEFEFPIRCSARLLFQMISTPTGLSDWFAEKVENIGDTDLIFIEVQSGEYFGEDDIVRFEDDYNRI